MTITEAIQAKKRAECEIEGILHALMDDTGATVNDLLFSTFTERDFSGEIVATIMDVKIKLGLQ